MLKHSCNRWCCCELRISTALYNFKILGLIFQLFIGEFSHQLNWVSWIKTYPSLLRHSCIAIFLSRKQKKAKRWKKSLPFLKACDEIYVIPCFKDVSPFWIDGHMFFNCYGSYQLLASVIHSVMPTWCLFNGNPWLKLIAEASRFILFNSLLCITAT